MTRGRRAVSGTPAGAGNADETTAAVLEVSAAYSPRIKRWSMGMPFLRPREELFVGADQQNTPAVVYADYPPAFPTGECSSWWSRTVVRRCDAEPKKRGVRIAAGAPPVSTAAAHTLAITCAAGRPLVMFLEMAIGHSLISSRSSTSSRFRSTRRYRFSRRSRSTTTMVPWSDSSKPRPGGRASARFATSRAAATVFSSSFPNLPPGRTWTA